MRRRDIITALCGATLLLPLTPLAQPLKKTWRIGFLGDGPRAERFAISVKPFLDGLQELGYSVGQNLLVEERWSEGDSSRLPSLATEFTQLKPDVIVTHGIPAATALRAATQDIAIVVAAAPDSLALVSPRAWLIRVET